MSLGGYIFLSKEKLINNTIPSPQNIQTPKASPQQTQKIPPVSSPTSLSENKVSVCAIYRSEKFGFEFTCPQGWYVTTSDLQPELGYQIYFVNDKSILTNENGFGDFISGINFSVEDNSKLLTLQQWIDQNISFEGGTSKSTKVAGVEGVRITGENPISRDESVMAIFSKGNRVFVFSTGGIYITALDQMLTTFRFLK